MKIEYNRDRQAGNVFIGIYGIHGICQDVTVRRNLIFDHGIFQKDGGAIYFIGRTIGADQWPGMLVTENWVETGGLDTVEEVVKGIYLDDIASGTVGSPFMITKNVFIDNYAESFQLHGGRHTRFSNNINLLVTGAGNALRNDQQLLFYQTFSGIPGYGDDMRDNILEKNILFSADNASFVSSSYGNDPYVTRNGAIVNQPIIRDNVLFVDFAVDADESSSTRADPQFEDAANFDFKLDPGSPAFTEGFVHILNVTDVIGQGPPANWGPGGYVRGNYPS